MRYPLTSNCDSWHGFWLCKRSGVSFMEIWTIENGRKAFQKQGKPILHPHDKETYGSAVQVHELWDTLASSYSAAAVPKSSLFRCLLSVHIAEKCSCLCRGLVILLVYHHHPTKKLSQKATHFFRSLRNLGVCQVPDPTFLHLEALPSTFPATDKIAIAKGDQTTEMASINIAKIVSKDRVEKRVRWVLSMCVTSQKMQNQ